MILFSFVTLFLCWSHCIFSLVFAVIGHVCGGNLDYFQTSFEFMLYVRRGIFEVQKEDPELHDGIQAHLSTCASPKVLEVAKKFP